MEKILSGDDKIRKAEEIYYKRKMKIPSSRFLKSDSEKKSYLGSKILLEIMIIANLSIIILGIQNKEYIFTKDFLDDIQKYNINITQNIKEFIGIDFVDESKETINTTNKNNDIEDVEVIEQSPVEEIVPNIEGKASSLNQMDEEIGKIKELVSIQKPINNGIITSRFGTRESVNKNVGGYHTGIDIGATKRNINIFCNVSEQ